MSNMEFIQNALNDSESYEMKPVLVIATDGENCRCYAAPGLDENTVMAILQTSIDAFTAGVKIRPLDIGK